MTHTWDDYLNSPELQEKVRAAYREQIAAKNPPPPKKPIIRTTTLMRQVEADLRAASPDVEFTLRPKRTGVGRWIDITWCNGPPEAEIRTVTDKHDSKAIGVQATRCVPCERCGGPVVDCETICLDCQIATGT